MTKHPPRKALNRAQIKKRVRSFAIGQKFGRWVVLARANTVKSGHRYWLCRCECGVEREVAANHLQSGKSQSCGCLKTEMASKRHATHGLSDTRTHNIWMNMRARCELPTNKSYSYYGGRGITVCRRWRKFEHFLADMGEAPAGLSLERLNNDKGYSPENCKWATRAEQMRNQRRTIRISHNGRTQSLSDWADEVGLAPLTIWKRLKRGWSEADALNPELKRRRV